MAVTHRILRPIGGVDHMPAGSLVDTTSWKHVAKLVDQRYLQPLTPEEVTAHEASIAAKASRANDEPKRKAKSDAPAATTDDAAAAKAADKPAADKPAASKPTALPPGKPVATPAPAANKGA